jgi:predicted enzyme related to lactoylglutathione lyase
MHGQFLWCDVMTTDTKAAADFYQAVVGWGVQAADTPDMPYTVLTVEGQGVAGIMPMPQGAQSGPVWFTYIAADDVDAACAKIEAEGGAIHRPPHTLPGVIRFAVVADPQGATFLVARGLSDQPVPVITRGTPGTIGWRELFTSDLDAGFAFYKAVFGWSKAEAHDMGPMGVYQLFKVPGLPDAAGGMMKKMDQMPLSYWGHYFTVEAIDAAAARVTAGGGGVLMGPHQVPGGDWIVQCKDPQGAYFSLTSPVK